MRGRCTQQRVKFTPRFPSAPLSTLPPGIISPECNFYIYPLSPASELENELQAVILCVAQIFVSETWARRSGTSVVVVVVSVRSAHEHTFQKKPSVDEVRIRFSTTASFRIKHFRPFMRLKKKDLGALDLP